MIAATLRGLQLDIAGWTYAPAPPPTPVPSTDPSAGAARRALGVAPRPRAAPRLPSGPVGGGPTVTDHGPEHPVHDADRDRPARPASPSRSTTRTPARRMTCRSRTRTARRCSRPTSSRASPTKTYPVGPLAPGTYTVRLHRALEHDRDAHGPVRASGDPDRPAALLLGRLRAVGRGARPSRRRRRRHARGSSTGPSSIPGAGASLRTAGCSCGRPTGGPGRSAPRARLDGEIVHELDPADGGPAGGRRHARGRPRLGSTAPAHADAHGAPRAVRRRLARLRRAGHRREHGAGQRAHGLRVRTDVRGPRRRDRGDGQRRAGPRAGCPGRRPAPGRGLRHPRPHPHEGQPPARGHRGDPDDRDRRARPPGRRRDPRLEHARGRSHPRDRLRVEGPDQQAHPHRPRGP